VNELELEALRRENAELRQQTLTLTAQIGQLVTELARLNERVAELLAVAQRKHRKPQADKPPAAPPTVEGEAQRAFEQRPKAPDKPTEEAPPKTKAKPTGRKPIPSHLEAEEHELRPRACAGCGETALDATRGEGIAAGRVWAEVDCPNAANPAVQKVCAATMQLRFENCAQK
jgi:transposase-like protein